MKCQHNLNTRIGRKMRAVKTVISVIHPFTLEEGRNYLLRTRDHTSREVRCVPVVFVGYCPCPAVVLVSDGAGKHWCCPREDLFTGETTNLDQFDRSLTADVLNISSSTRY